MEIHATDQIAKWLDINILDHDQACWGPPKAPVPIQIISRDEQGLTIRGLDQVPGPKGPLTFHACGICFEAQSRPLKGASGHTLRISLPERLIHAGKRRHPRLPFESRENNILHLWSERLGRRFPAILYNVSAGGLGFFLATPNISLHSGESLLLTGNLLNLSMNAFLSVRYTRGNLAGASFADLSQEESLTLNKAILEALDWRSEQHVTLLRNRQQTGNKIQNLEKERSSHKEGARHYLDLINPFLESAISVLDRFLSLPLTRESVEIRTITTALYDASTYLHCTADALQFQFFLCMSEDTLLNLAERLMGFRPESMDASVRDFLGELGNMIVGNAKNELSGDMRYHLSTPGLIVGKKHVLSTLSQYPAIRISFSSPAGPVDTVLFISEVLAKTGKLADLSQNPLENMGFVEPIFSATTRIFSDFLGIQVKEKSINVRNPLTPKFDVTAFLGISNETMEGQVILNMSGKLALHIYQKLLGETLEELNEQVRDSVGEILNMITGNAKSEFSESHLYYHLSTPFVVVGKDQVIQNVGSTPFVSSAYWTSAGFFELSFALSPKPV